MFPCRWKHRVRTDYKEYYSSGFLSIQVGCVWCSMTMRKPPPLLFFQRPSYKLYKQCAWLTPWCAPQNAIDGYVLGSGADGEGRVGPLDVAGNDSNATAASAGSGTQRAWTEWGLVFPVAAYHHNKCAADMSCHVQL